MLKTLPSDFIQCVVTSPPYFGLRSYLGGSEDWDDGWRGQLGGEPSPDLYIQHLIQIMREVKRVLRPDGVFWANIGDSWAGSNKGLMGDGTAVGGAKQQTMRGSVSGDLSKGFRGDGVKPLDMILIPSLLAIAARADGWYVRSMVIWSKNNPMPESTNGVRWEKHRIKIVKSARASDESYHAAAYGNSPMGARDGRDFANHDKEWVDCPGCPKCAPNDGLILRRGSWRPTDSYEFILMLTKTDSYYCDREAVLEPVAESSIARVSQESFDDQTGGSKDYAVTGVNPNRSARKALENFKQNNGGGRNLRSVWQINTSPFKGAHFATFPLKVPLTAIKSSISEKGCCPKCGAPWARLVSKKRLTRPELPKDDVRYRPNVYNGAYAEINGHGDAGYTESETLGWRPTCSCDAGNSIPCRVLDPFSGAGTTALAADILGCDSFNIDTSSEYIEMSKARLAAEREKRASTSSINHCHKLSAAPQRPETLTTGVLPTSSPNKPLPEPSTHPTEDFTAWLSRIRKNI